MHRYRNSLSFNYGKSAARVRRVPRSQYKPRGALRLATYVFVAACAAAGTLAGFILIAAALSLP